MIGNKIGTENKEPKKANFQQLQRIWGQFVLLPPEYKKKDSRAIKIV